MQHPDEGTIHAWLDGQLPADEAARLDEHVASCADCAAKVAEARGLIAASSRIVTALDHTPAGVIPIQSRKAPRRFRITPVLTAIAATVVLAAGALLVQRGQTPTLNDSTIVVKTANDSPAALPLQLARPAKASDTLAPRISGSQPDVGPQPKTRLTPMQKVGAPPPAVPSLPSASTAQMQTLAAEARADSARMNRASEAVVQMRDRSAVAGMSAGGGVGSRAPARAAAPASAMATDFAERKAAEDRALAMHVGCYEANESTDVLPRRFALEAGGQVRYVDSTQKRDGVIPDVTWTDSSGIAVIRNKAGTDLLRIRRENNELLADAPAKERRVRTLACTD